MKWFLTLLGLLALVSSAARAEEMHKGQQVLSVGLGGQRSTGENVEGKNWYLVGLGLDHYHLAHLAFGGEFFYQRQSDLGARIVRLELGVGAKALLYDNTNSPYLKLLAGANFGDPIGSPRLERSLAAGLGWQVKGGGGTGYFLEGLYNLVTTEDADDIKFLKLRLGFSFYLGRATH